MTRKCFYAEHLDSGSEFAELRDQTAHHIESVLRLKPGDSIEVRDGLGNGWGAEILVISGGVVRVRLKERQLAPTESPLRLTLAMAFARSDRMELVLRQATEIGIHEFIAFRTRRSQYGLRETHLGKKRERWLKIAREALCQCGRTVLPQVHFFSDLPEFISTIPPSESSDNSSLRMLALEEGSRQNVLSLWKTFPMYKQVMIAIGPEGGWVQDEVDQFVHAGFRPVSLGPRTLRLETAAIALLGSAQLLWGDFGERV